MRAGVWVLNTDGNRHAQASLDSIAEERHRSSREIGVGGRFNPHRSILGLGNYDVVVMETAVTQQGCSWQVMH